jgi:ribosomal protein S12 methylthiotransferase accessory factor
MLPQTTHYKEGLEREAAFIEPVHRRIASWTSEQEKPFAEKSLFAALAEKIFLKICKALESALAAKLFVKAFGDEFDFVDSGIKKLIAKLLDKEVIGSFRFHLPPSDWPKMICANAPLKQIKLPSGMVRQVGGTTGGGCGFDHNAAAGKALAEALERYSLCVYDPQKFIWGSFQELERRSAVDPRKFACFSEKQFKDRSYFKDHYFDAQTRFQWTHAQSLFDSQRYLVPAQLVFMPYERGEGEPIIRQTTTNGAAAGSSWEMAAYNALCEAIERDAFMIFWLNQLAPPKINLLNVQNPVLKAVLEQCRRCAINITLFDITTDLEIPTVLAVLLNTSGGGQAVQVSASADLDIEKAMLHAVPECLKAFFWKDISADAIQKVKALAPHLRTIEQRRIFWADRAKTKHMEFLFQGPEKPLRINKFAGLPDGKKLEAMKQILKNKNGEVYLADATSPLAKEAGLTVLMSLIPGLYPLYLNEHYKYLGIRRLYETPVRLGYLGEPKKEEELNPVPHPFL